MLSKPAKAATGGLRFFVFTCRDPGSDFRRPLVEALRKRYETWYVWVRRRPVVTTPDGTQRELSLPAFLRLAARFPLDDKLNVYFNSTNAIFPGFSFLLRMVSARGLWCFDVHDDLRYHYSGLKRIREATAIRVLRRIHHVLFRAAPTLAELFPESHWIGNASHLGHLPRNSARDRDVLILASFDERFDADFLAELAAAAPDFDFHLHGRTRSDDPETLRRIETLAERHANVRYHGPYTIDSLPGILTNYRLSVAPYRTNSILTRYIDPLRFYHCLNAGLETVSTDIPAAHAMSPWIHIVNDAGHCAEMLRQIRTGQRSHPSAYEPITWDDIVTRIVNVVQTSTNVRGAGSHDASRQDRG